MDPIDRQAAIDAFNTDVDELIVGGKRNAEVVEKYLNGVIGGIKELPPAQLEQRWIPCSERLPESSNFYIVTRKGFSVGFIWYSVFHGWEWQEEGQPIAWMPLPEPYGGE